MDKVKQAAILLLGMGEKHAADILKSMEPSKVEEVMEAINQLENVTEVDMIHALNNFFKEANNSSGIDIVSKEMFKNSISNVVESKKIEAKSDPERLSEINGKKFLNRSHPI